MTEQKTNVHADQAAPKRSHLDLRQALERLKLRGPSTQALLEHGRKDIEALLAANERVFTGFEAINHKQAALLADIMREWQAAAKDAVSPGSSPEKVNHAQRAFSHALASMKEMADIAAKAHEDVLTILNERYQANVEEFRQSLNKPPRS